MAKLLVDTNVLMLLLIGRWDRTRISRFRRTDRFDAADFDKLEAHLRRYAGLVTTAPVLTEASNLMGNAFHQTIARTVVEVCSGFDEHVAAKERIFVDGAFARLGFGDSSILVAAEADRELVVLTDDIGLYLELLTRAFQAVNFHHLRVKT